MAMWLASFQGPDIGTEKVFDNQIFRAHNWEDAVRKTEVHWTHIPEDGWHVIGVTRLDDAHNVTNVNHTYGMQA